jgi:hypothetical protein
VVLAQILIPTPPVSANGVDSINPRHPPRFSHRLEAGTLTDGISAFTRFGLFPRKRPGSNLHWDNGNCWPACATVYPKLKIHSYAAEDLTNHVAFLTTISRAEPADLGSIWMRFAWPPFRPHCAPLRTMDLKPAPGGVRFSPGLFNTPEDIDQAIEAMTDRSRR